MSVFGRKSPSSVSIRASYGSRNGYFRHSYSSDAMRVFLLFFSDPAFFPSPHPILSLLPEQMIFGFLYIDFRQPIRKHTQCSHSSVPVVTSSSSKWITTGCLRHLSLHTVVSSSPMLLANAEMDSVSILSISPSPAAAISLLKAPRQPSWSMYDPA